jgi:hypothetical protein
MTASGGIGRWMGRNCKNSKRRHIRQRMESGQKDGKGIYKFADGGKYVWSYCDDKRDEFGVRKRKSWKGKKERKRCSVNSFCLFHFLALSIWGV